MTDIAYIYRPKPTDMALATGMAFCLLSLFYYAAQNCDQGVTLFHIITLSTEQTTFLLWGMFAVSGVLVLMAFFSIFVGLTSKATLRLTDTTLFVPRGFFNDKIASVAYAEIYLISTASDMGHVFIHIYHGRNKTRVYQSMMGSRHKFEEMLETLKIRIDAVG